MTTFDGEQSSRIQTLAVSLLSGIIALLVLPTSPYLASNLTIYPDSVEYALGAINIAQSGHFVIQIDGETLPSRYLPWFSLIALAPVFKLFGSNPGNAIIPVTSFGLLGIAAAFMIGRRISGNWGAFFAAIMLLLLPVYYVYSQHVMTDVPCAALTLVLCMLFIRLRTSPQEGIKLYIAAGILAGIAAAFRPACAALALPFLLASFRAGSASHITARLSAIAVPQLLQIGASILFNNCIFGSPLQTGYGFWCPNDCTDPRITFSVTHFTDNLLTLTITGLPILLLVNAFLWFYTRKRSTPSQNDGLKALVIFTLLGTGPILLMHLVYFWKDQRFFLPSLVLLTTLCGSLLGMILKSLSNRWLIGIQVLSVIAAIGFVLQPSQSIPARRLAAEDIGRLTPTNSIIISGMDPAYLGYFAAKNSERRILPLSRNVEYTSTIVSFGRRTSSPPIMGTTTNSLPGTTGGLFPVVALERPDLIADAIRSGTPVFMDTSYISLADSQGVQELTAFFCSYEVTSRLYQLGLKKPPQ